MENTSWHSKHCRCEGCERVAANTTDDNPFLKLMVPFESDGANALWWLLNCWWLWIVAVPLVIGAMLKQYD